MEIFYCVIIFDSSGYISNYNRNAKMGLMCVIIILKTSDGWELDKWLTIFFL